MVRKMVDGLKGFREWFGGYEENYVIIGGTACELLLNEVGENFRATQDIDMVVIIEALDANYGLQFWEYVKGGEYEYRNKSTGKPHFYRFTKPKKQGYPKMLELFSRHPDEIEFPSSARLTTLSLDDDVSSLSAILLDDEYYEFLRQGIKIIDALPILDAGHMIPFKAKAWLNLSKAKANGDNVDSKNIKKHQRDVLQLSTLLMPEYHLKLPSDIEADVNEFLAENTDDSEASMRIRAAFSLA
ncbi:MAG: hypothetical protein LBN34_01015 [Clostridiales Family XIII bacterium]|jgi:hypothetical protein|nr:hypothetical protein [Clostridiales Family XIII bacterium]